MLSQILLGSKMRFERLFFTFIIDSVDCHYDIAIHCRYISHQYEHWQIEPFVSSQQKSVQVRYGNNGTHRSLQCIAANAGGKEKLLEVSSSISAELNLNHFFKAMNAVTYILQADRSTLFLYDRHTQRLWSVVAEGQQQTNKACDTGIAGHFYYQRHHKYHRCLQ